MWNLKTNLESSCCLQFRLEMKLISKKIEMAFEHKQKILRSETIGEAVSAMRLSLVPFQSADTTDAAY